MGMENQASYVKQAHRAEVHEDTPAAKRIEALKKSFEEKKLAGPFDKNGQDVLNKNVGDFLGMFLRGYKSVEHMENICKDGNKTETQKQFAMDDLDLLGKAVYESVRGKGDFAASIGKGSASEIDEKLPKEFKGIGKIVLTNVFEKGPVLDVLSNLDLTRAGLRRVTSGEVKNHQLTEAVNEAMTELRKLRGLSPGQNHDREMSMAYLGAELAGMEGQSKRGVVEEQQEDDSLPEGRERQLALVRVLLEKIESSQRTTRDLYMGQYAAKLEELTSRADVEPDVAIEVRSRLKLHDSSVLMRKANGYVDVPKSGGDPECPTVGMAATLAEGMGHALDNEAIGFFLKSEANGIPTALAWDKYQQVNCFYRDYLEKMKKGLSRDLENIVVGDPDMGTIDSTYFTDSDSRRKRLVDDRVVEEISASASVDTNAARKAWELAKKMAIATGEDSVFNADLTGNDEMAEDIYLKIYRSRRDEKGRPRGPQITLEKISGLGNSWLRQVSRYQPYDKVAPPYKSSGVKPLYAKDVVVEPSPVKKVGIEDGSYVFHFGVWWTAKIHPLRDLLLQRDPDPQKMLNTDSFQTAVDYFNKADFDRSKKLRRYWVAGVLDMACSNGDLGWTQDDISKFRQFATSVKLSEKAGVFIERKEWDDLMKRGGFANKMLKLDLKRVVTGFGSGGKKR